MTINLEPAHTNLNIHLDPTCQRVVTIPTGVLPTASRWAVDQLTFELHWQRRAKRHSAAATWSDRCEVSLPFVWDGHQDTAHLFVYWPGVSRYREQQSQQVKWTRTDTRASTAREIKTKSNVKNVWGSRTRSGHVSDSNLFRFDDSHDDFCLFSYIWSLSVCYRPSWHQNGLRHSRGNKRYHVVSLRDTSWENVCVLPRSRFDHWCVLCVYVLLLGGVGGWEEKDDSVFLVSESQFTNLPAVSLSGVLSPSPCLL